MCNFNTLRPVDPDLDKLHNSTILFRLAADKARPSLIQGLSMNYHDVITIQSGKRGGRPCIRGMRISVADVLGWLAAGMSHDDILRDYPELTDDDIRACLAYAADRERRVVTTTT